jgi:subtilisin family serine protease
VITIEWKGKKVDVIAGRFALKRRDRSTDKVGSLEEQLSSAISHPAVTRRSKVEVIQLDPQVEMTDITEIVASILERNHEIEWIEPVTISQGSSIPNDERYVEQWGLKEVRFEQSLAHSAGNLNRVVLAILDTGIPLQTGILSHPDLRGEQRFFIGPDFVGHDDDPADDHGHGTHIAGIAAATTNNELGIAAPWQGPVYIVKVLDAQNRGSSENFADGVTDAISFARDRQARLVVNYSGRIDGDQMLARTAINDLLQSNGILVAAAGNNFGFEVDFPAAYSVEFPNVIAVGATDKNRNRPEFASSGPQITVVAPGVSILSTLPNYHVTLNNTVNKKSLKYDSLDGTSQSAAFVSALAALVWAKFPQFTAPQVRERISQSTIPLNGPPEDFGSGLINMENALS